MRNVAAIGDGSRKPLHATLWSMWQPGFFGGTSYSSGLRVRNVAAIGNGSHCATSALGSAGLEQPGNFGSTSSGFVKGDLRVRNVAAAHIVQPALLLDLPDWIKV